MSSKQVTASLISTHGKDISIYPMDGLYGHPNLWMKSDNGF